jgi:hypothetical protein
MVTLEQIQRIAERESTKYHHYYIGVEHLFIALTKLQNGLTNTILLQNNLEPKFVRYSIRQTIGTNEDRRYWTGFQITPRAAKIIDHAKELTASAKTQERDLLLAILDENDSIPIRVLHEIGANVDVLKELAATLTHMQIVEPPPIEIEQSSLQVPLSDDEQMVLQRMFRDNDYVMVERELSGGYTGARLLLIEPYRARRAEARVVVKIDEKEVILYEKRHYDSYIRYNLPPMTARLIDNPSLPSKCRLGGLKYSFVEPSGNPETSEEMPALDLRAFAMNTHYEHLSRLIRKGIYENFRKTWWAQKQRYRFGVWREYELVLPAALEIEVAPDIQDIRRAIILNPMEPWSREVTLVPGQLVHLKGFTIQKIRNGDGDQPKVQFNAGAGSEAVYRASKVEVFGFSPERLQRVRRGMLVENVYGYVKRTRNDVLLEQVMALEPDFDVTEMDIPAPEPVKRLPNPLRYVEMLLNQQMSGNLSIIHGDLHLGNVIGRGDDAWLIDFALAREGHTLFDWATLEISLLSSFVSVYMPDGWDGVWGTVRLLQAVNRFDLEALPQNNPVASALRPVVTLRRIVEENLARPDYWPEYYVALTMLALRGISWDTVSVAVRRLLFLTSAVAIEAALTSGMVNFTTSGHMTRGDWAATELFEKPDSDENLFESKPDVPPTHEDD